MANIPTINKIQLPSGYDYFLEDTEARDAIAALEGKTYFLGKSLTALTDGATTNPINVDGKGSVTATNGNVVAYGNAEFVWDGAKWIEFGDLSTLGSLAYESSVSLNKGNGANALGENATFTTTVTPTTTNIAATASGATVGADGTDTFVKSYPGATSQLATTSIPNVSSAGSASTWSFAMGTGTDAKTLIISGANGSAPTLDSPITAATGSLVASGGGASVMTGLGTPTTATALTGVKMTAQPTVALATGATAGTGVISVATGITSAATTTNSKDAKKVALYDDLSVSVS